MNRLILLGNGFDLAHGMQTSYTDFLEWYLKRCFNLAQKDGIYKDQLLEIGCPYTWLLARNASALIDKLIDSIFNENLQIVNEEFYFWDTYETFKNPFKIIYQADLIKILCDQCAVNRWVDIENEYYKEVKKIRRNPNKAAEVSKLNNDFAYLIKLLETYLKSLPTPPLSLQYREIIKSPISQKETLNYNSQAYPISTMILNFNYTTTIEKYLDSEFRRSTAQEISVNYIHGKLDDPSNPMIFGFGDELDENYAMLEKESTKGFLDYVKSFWYFKTHNYHDLIRFIDSEKFQVHIWGHSCGLSDRTMLNMIFEHPFCESIKIFYHESAPGINNYTQLTQEISRHFTNKADMRRKIVPLPFSIAMPQLVPEMS